MNIAKPPLNLKVSAATKFDKKDIQRFYKAQHHSARFIGNDLCYLVKIEQKIIASAIVSAGQENSDTWLLHGLVTDNNFRNLGIASLILKSIMAVKNEDNLINFTKIICFADQLLQSFYCSNHFQIIPKIDETDDIPAEFIMRFKRYRKTKKNLQCFIYRRTHKSFD